MVLGTDTQITLYWFLYDFMLVHRFHWMTCGVLAETSRVTGVEDILSVKVVIFFVRIDYRCFEGT